MNMIESEPDQWSYDDSLNLSGTIRNRRLIKTLNSIDQIIKIKTEANELFITGREDNYILIFVDNEIDTGNRWFNELIPKKGSSKVEAFTTWIRRGGESMFANKK